MSTILVGKVVERTSFGPEKNPPRYVVHSVSYHQEDGFQLLCADADGQLYQFRATDFSIATLPPEQYVRPEPTALPGPPERRR